MTRADAPSAHEYRAELALGAPFLVVATAVALLLDSGRSFDLGPAIVLVLAYGALSHVRFYAGAGHTVPTQLVFVTMLYTLPTELVPLLVLLGMVVGNLPDYARGVLHPARMLMLPGDAWHAIGPALVLLAAGAVDPTGGDWVWLIPALLAQFAIEFVVSAVRAQLALDIPLRDQLRALEWVWLVDALLTPLGVLAAMASVDRPYAFLLVLPLALLLTVFARERNERLEQALELGGAYRGIAMLLGDLLEDADEYTGGDHTRGVVALSLEVADELGLDVRERHNVELAALLHDIGKIVIPTEIINRPGPLDEREWELMKSHTIEGQRMLDRVGGPLADIGRIVRASHERWDGGGYPDGLTERTIPREATVVAACDAFNAMTTDRSYRQARSTRAALEELREHAGRQFAPEVVDAIVRVVARELPEEERSAATSASLRSAQSPVELGGASAPSSSPLT
ncbi:HD-GYP domain-containing protein [Conexibacter woesei]|uniref:Metal dependent phosphohydrolase n=1 Tax=Conexibacter woesei (strain DSM 14684 / CCUG 47730 / CIP 108061 / JCM 11494 / NBRC 100937 / ID131577) TaxID=469383 RepID=D3F2D7_CONWI|nr:HD-GYP domain-containing protein [Conexibacter woesei]ADB52203.1 metal dependent phosphohydrolase [Conexibacter woesei DSM 14684]